MYMDPGADKNVKPVKHAIGYINGDRRMPKAVRVPSTRDVEFQAVIICV